MKNKKYKSLLIVLIIVMLVGLLFLLGKSYSIISYLKESEKINVVSIKGLATEVISGENNLVFNNSNPVYDSQGLSNDPFIFTVKNVSNATTTFNVTIENDSNNQVGSVLSYDYIKFSYSNDGVNYSDAKTLSEVNNIVLTNTLASNIKNTIYLKLWVASNTPNSEQGKSFYGKVIVTMTN